MNTFQPSHKDNLDLTQPFDPKWFLKFKYRAVSILDNTACYHFTAKGVEVPNTPIVPLEGWSKESTLIFGLIDKLSHANYVGEARFEFDDGNGPKMFYGKWTKKGDEHTVTVKI